MKVPMFNRCTTLSYLCISSLALLMGFTLSALLLRVASEWDVALWAVVVASSLVSCLVLFPLCRRIRKAWPRWRL